jgi:phospholipase C
MSGTIDPNGLAGGPIISAAEGETPFSWTTMPERLEALGITWQIYSAPDSTYEDGDNTVIYFEQYHSNPTLNAKALQPTYDDFLRDAAAGNLPQVSWVISPVGILEHPLQSTPQLGQLSFEKVFDAVTANKAAWKKTALVITYDENGGYFDHLPPPMPEPGTPDEFLTVSPLPDSTGDITGPIGLGPRVPTMIVSPFSRGGFVSSDVFDHTSTLLFLETRFGVEVPNLSAWRRETCGDLTSAFNFAQPDFSVPTMPKPRKLKEPGAVCSPVLAKYPKTKDVPRQPSGKAKRPSGLAT